MTINIHQELQLLQNSLLGSHKKVEPHQSGSEVCPLAACVPEDRRQSSVAGLQSFEWLRTKPHG